MDTWKALICRIPRNEVTGRYEKSSFCKHLEQIPRKKLLSVILNSISIIFKEEKLDKFQIDFYNIYTIGIDIINFHVNIFNELVLTITFYLVLLHNF